MARGVAGSPMVGRIILLPLPLLLYLSICSGSTVWLLEIGGCEDRGLSPSSVFERGAMLGLRFDGFSSAGSGIWGAEGLRASDSRRSSNSLAASSFRLMPRARGRALEVFDIDETEL